MNFNSEHSFWHQSEAIGINLKQLASIGINWHQSASIGINWHQLASIGINQHQSASISIKQHQAASSGINRHQSASSGINWHQSASFHHHTIGINQHQLASFHHHTHNHHQTHNYRHIPSIYIPIAGSDDGIFKKFYSLTYPHTRLTRCYEPGMWVCMWIELFENSISKDMLHLNYLERLDEKVKCNMSIRAWYVGMYVNRTF